MKILGIIPSRYGSTRFPGKPLIDIDGKSMIQRVYEQVVKTGHLTHVVVATDDERIFNHVKTFEGDTVMTSTSHESGTDRCAEVLEHLTEEYDVVINIQGDEPYIDPIQINQLCNCFDDIKTDIATLAKKITSSSELFNENKPKMVISVEDFAIYFSRNPIPFLRGIEKEDWAKKHDYFKHVGIYGYRSEVLKKITQLKPSSLEKSEGLEQLRWIENGFAIKVAKTDIEAISIDTPEDLENISFK